MILRNVHYREMLIDEVIVIFIFSEIKNSAIYRFAIQLEIIF